MFSPGNGRNQTETRGMLLGGERAVKDDSHELLLRNPARAVRLAFLYHPGGENSHHPFNSEVSIPVTGLPMRRPRPIPRLHQMWRHDEAGAFGKLGWTFLERPGAPPLSLISFNNSKMRVPYPRAVCEGG